MNVAGMPHETVYGADGLNDNTSFILYNFVHSRTSSSQDEAGPSEIMSDLAATGTLNSIGHPGNAFNAHGVLLVAEQQSMSGQQQRHTAFEVRRSTEYDRVIEEDGALIDSNAPAVMKLEQGLRLMTPSDWEKWRPFITDVYKRGTARMILKEMTSAGFHVTDKMLRDRFRKWSIDNKNRRPEVLINRYRHNGLARPRLERPISTNSNDVHWRSLLSTLDDYFQSTYERRLNMDAGLPIYHIFLRILNAIDVCIYVNSQAGWDTLRMAEIQLREADWSQISIGIMISMIRAFAEWRLSAGDLANKLLLLVRRLVSWINGERHPFTMMMEFSLCGYVDMNTYWKIFLIADTKTALKSMSIDERDFLDSLSKLCWMDTLWNFNESKMLEEALMSWTPPRGIDQFCRLWGLAQLRHRLGQFPEAERFYQYALEMCSWETVTTDEVIQLVCGYSITLLDQDRRQEASSVFLESLKRYDEVADHHDNDARERAIHIDWFRAMVDSMRSKYRVRGEFDKVIARLETMSLECNKNLNDQVNVRSGHIPSISHLRNNCQS